MTENNIETIISSAEKIYYLPQGYVVKDGTLQLVGKDKDGNEKNILISDPLYVLACTRDSSSANWGRLITWHDADGKSHEWAMPSAMLAGDGAEYRRILLDQGLNIRSGRAAANALHDYIQIATPPDRVSSVLNPGWCQEVYIEPDGTIYGSDNERFILQVSGVSPKIDRLGTVETWQEKIGKYAVGNSRLVFGIAVGLTGPLLKFLNEGSGGFHISGSSSSGKTTLLRLAASVSGAPLRSWRTTDNSAESWARFSNDGFLAIDELSQVDGRAADAMAYMLGNGQGKGRANRDGIARDVASFRLIFLSTGEIGLAEKIGEGQRKARAGQAVRMIEIPCDAGQRMGVFENLHTFKDGAEFSKHLTDASEKNRGYILPVFLKELTKIDGDKLTETIGQLVNGWIKQNVPQGADGQVKRAARRFAIVAVAGEMAARLGILPWPEGEADRASATCFKDWLHTRGGAGSQEVTDGIKEILSFINRFGMSRFSNCESPDEKINDRAGFRRAVGGNWEYLFFPDILRTEVLAGSKNEKDIIRTAVARGLISPDKEGKSTQNIRLPGLGQKRVYVITPFVDSIEEGDHVGFN